MVKQLNYIVEKPDVVPLSTIFIMVDAASLLTLLLILCVWPHQPEN